MLVYRHHLLPGSETFILNQVAAMSRYEAILVGGRRVPGLDLSAQRVEVANGGGWAGRLAEVAVGLGHPPRAFVRDLGRFGSCLVHAHFGFDGLRAAALTRSLALPLVVTFHGYDVTRTESNVLDLPHRNYRRRLPVLAEQVDLSIAVSDFIRRHLLKLGFPDDKVQVHYIGVDTKAWPALPLQGRESVVLGVGRFVEKKGFQYLIDAVAEIQRSGRKAKLVLIGSGPLDETLRSRARQSTGDCEFLGSRPASEVKMWMGRARVLAVPSVTAASGDTEGLPITVLEALSSGLPVVASEHAGIPEAVIDGTTGLLARERDVHGLARHLTAILSDDQLWTRLSTEARARVGREFDLARQTEKLERMYDEVAHPDPGLYRSRGCPRPVST
ncbi:MAG: glycosyltransferase [Solirubrobacteraceae bacterium]